MALHLVHSFSPKLVHVLYSIKKYELSMGKCSYGFCRLAYF